MITIQKTNCVVCGEEISYYDLKQKPETCWKTRCKTNYNAAKNRRTLDGNHPDLKELGTWNPSKK